MKNSVRRVLVEEQFKWPDRPLIQRIKDLKKIFI